MPLTEAEHQMILDLRKEINEIKRERTRLRTGIVTDITGPVVKVQMGGECGGNEIEVVANGPVAEGDNVTLLEGGGGAVITGQALQGGESGFDPGTGITIDGKQIAVDASVARKNLDAQLIGVGNPTEWNHGANKNYVDLSLGKIPEHASLPSSPFDGQCIFYNGWLCRYDSSPPFAPYPWAVLGGSLFGQSASVATLTSESYVSPTTPISLSLPSGIKGVFVIEISGHAYFEFPVPSNVTAGIRHSYRINTGATDDDNGWVASFEPYNPEGVSRIGHTWGSGTRKEIVTITTAGATINERARKMFNVNAVVQLSRRWIEVTPKWIGL